MREASGPVCSLEGGGTSSLWGGRSGLLLQAQKFRDVWVVLVFRGLPPSLPGLHVRDAGFPKRTFDASRSVSLRFSHSCCILGQCLYTA